MVRSISVRELNSMCTGCFEAGHVFWCPVISFRDPHPSTWSGKSSPGIKALKRLLHTSRQLLSERIHPKRTIMAVSFAPESRCADLGNLQNGGSIILASGLIRAGK